MALAQQPVRAVARIGAAAAIRHVVHQRVTEDVVFRLLGRHVVGRAADDDRELTFPIDTIASGGQAGLIAVARDGRGQLREQIRILARVSGFPFPDSGNRRRCRRRRGRGTPARAISFPCST